MQFNELQSIEQYFDRLWPICRSITGDGLRKSLHILSELIPLKLCEVPTGTKVFDWEVPREWNINDAYIICPDGRKIADFKENNLHIVNYSIPIDTYIEFDELSQHLYYIDNQPDAIPYRTSYYRDNWGFCLTKKEYNSLPKEGVYKVYIDSSLKRGSLTYGELILKGETNEEILFSTYMCHPSLANNELSGPLVLAFLYQRIAKKNRRKYTYRFVVTPETIGSITYLSRNGRYLKSHIKAGYIITCVGDSGNFTYKCSRSGNSYADQVAKHVLKHNGIDYQIVDFSPIGSDERQYCSPGFNLPVGSLMRTMYGKYPEYHTSLDNKEFISFIALQETVNVYESIVDTIESDEVFSTLVPNCEPHLGKRNLYPATTNGCMQDDLKSLLWVLNFADGDHSLLDIAEKANMPISLLISAAEKLKQAKLIV